MDDAVAASVSERDDGQREGLAHGLIRFGLPFVRAVLAADDAAGGAACHLLEGWLAGGRISDRADEPERRVSAARQLHEATPDAPYSTRLLASAILALPADHDERELDVARHLVIEGVREARRNDAGEEELRGITLALDHALVSPEDADTWIRRGDTLCQTAAADDTSDFRTAALTYCLGQLTAAEAARDEVARQTWTRRVEARAAPDAREDGPPLRGAVQLQLHRAVQLQVQERYEEAAVLWGGVVAKRNLGSPAIQQFALEQGRCLVKARRYGEATSVLAAMLPHAERAYIDSIRPEDIDTCGHRVENTALWLAFAQAQTADWGNVVRSLDRGRALRSRYLASMRRTPASRQAISLHREIEQAHRIGAPARALAELRERYRLASKGMDRAVPSSPSVAEVAAVLEPTEAVAVMAIHPNATLAAIVLPGDREEPSGRFADDEWTHDRWMWLFAGEDDGAGWVTVLERSMSGDPSLDPFLALDLLRHGADEALAQKIRALLDAHGATRLTIIAGQLLALIPWWTVPSLVDLDIVIAPTLSEVVSTRKTPAPMGRRALFVRNPTGDARTSDIASEAAAAQLMGVNVSVVDLPHSLASEASVVHALDGCGMFHFAGHGRWNIDQGGLELHPDPPISADPFPDWAAHVSAWRSEREADQNDPEQQRDAVWAGRHGDVQGLGRIHERTWLNGPRRDRWLERPGGTLIATYRGDTIMRIAELWSASDILAGDAFRSCRLCVLIACESAARSGGGDPARPDLPGALTIAGANTVVGTLWPIEDRFAAVWTECFYSLLGPALAAGGRIDIAALVRRAAGELRGMETEGAAHRLRAMGQHVDDPIFRFSLEAEASTLPVAGFADPWYWGAFYVTGCPTIEC